MRIPASTTQAAYPSQMTARLAYASSTFPTSSYPIDNRLFNDARGLYHSLDHAPSHPGIYSTSVGHLHNAGNRAQAQSQHSFVPPQPFSDSGSNYSAYPHVGPEAFYSSPASSITPLEAISPMYSHAITNFTTHPPHSAHTYPYISPIYPQGPMTYAYITPSYPAQPSPAPFDTVTDYTSPALLADMPYNNIASMPIDADRCLQRGHAKPSRQRYAPYSAKRSTHRSSDHYSIIVSDYHCAPGVDGSANSMASTSSVPSRCVFSSPAHLSGSSPASDVSDAINESSWSSRPYFDTVPAAYHAQTPSLFLQGPLNAGAQITSIPLDTAPDNSSRGLDPSMAIQTCSMRQLMQTHFPSPILLVFRSHSCLRRLRMQKNSHLCLATLRQSTTRSPHQDSCQGENRRAYTMIQFHCGAHHSLLSLPLILPWTPFRLRKDTPWTAEGPAVPISLSGRRVHLATQENRTSIVCVVTMLR